MQKFIAILLSLCFISALFVACNDETATETGVIGEITAESGIPDDVRFDGKKIIIFTESRDYADLISLAPFTDKLNGDKLNDEIYNRERVTEERFGISIENVTVPLNELTDQLVLSVQSQLDDYQLVQPTCYDAAHFEVLPNNIFFNLLNRERFPYLNLSQPWYFDKFIDEAAYDDRLYFVTGDLSLDLIGNMYAVFFNKTLACNIGYTDKQLYQLVRDGDWTIDKQLEISKQGYSDVTGNGKTEDDIFGIAMGNLISVNAYMSAFDMVFVEQTDSGELQFALANPNHMDRHTKIVEKVYDMLYNRNDIHVYDNYESTELECWTEVIDKFAKEETMFVNLRLSSMSSQSIRKMDSDYGILPVPKFSDEQDQYYTNSYGAYTVWTIPTTTVDTELASAVLEYLSFYSYNFVSPTYYNDLLNGQYTRDLDSTEMMDLITRNFKVDFGEIYNYCLGKYAQESFRYLISEDESTNVNRFWIQNKKLFNKKLEQFVADWAKLKELGA